MPVRAVFEPDMGAAGNTGNPDYRKKGGRRPLAEPHDSVVQHVVDRRGSVRAGAVPGVARSQEKAQSKFAGMRIAPRTFEHATGEAAPPGTRKYTATTAVEAALAVDPTHDGHAQHDKMQSQPPPQYDPSFAGVASKRLAQKKLSEAAAIGDASKRKHMCYGNASAVATVPIHSATRSSGPADVRSFDGHAGSLSKNARRPGFDPELQDKSGKPTRKQSVSSVPEMLFGREPSGEAEMDEPDEFQGAAGVPSSANANAGIFATGANDADRLRPEDIPKPTFQPSRKKSVPSQGSQSEELMYNQELDENDTNFTETAPQYLGAAGETTKKSSERVGRELLASTNRATKAGTSQIDNIVFMHDLDNSEADDGYEDQLYQGAGNRSNTNYNPMDMSTRRADHLTDEMLYGSHLVHGSRLDDVPPQDPRNFEDYAGNSTKYLSERTLSCTDITRRMANVGSSVVNPSQADEIIFGHNADQSEGDMRDFEGAAGQGGRRRGMTGDITTVRQLRPGSASVQEMQRDSAMNATGPRPQGDRGRSQVDVLAQNGAPAGVSVKAMDLPSGYEHHRGDNKKLMIKEGAFDLIRGESSEAVRTLVTTNPTFEGSAGVTAHRLNEPRLDHARRAQPKDMVLDPHVPRAVQQLASAKKAEYQKLYGSQVERVLQQLPPEPVEATGGSLDEHAGLTSDKLATMHPAVATDKFSHGGHATIFATPDYLLDGSAGQRGSPSVLLAKSRKGALGPPREAIADRIIHQDPTVVPTRPAWHHKERSGEQDYDVLAGMRSETQQKNKLEYRIYDAKLAGKRPNPGMLGDVDEVVFGRDTDASDGGSIHEMQEQRRASMIAQDKYRRDSLIAAGALSQAEAPEEPMTFAGAHSKMLSEAKDWDHTTNGKRKYVTGANAGSVDEVVFGHDLDGSGLGSATLTEDPVFYGGKGLSTDILSISKTLNDPTARMHMPIEYYERTSSANDSSVDEVVFGFDQDFSGTNETGIIGKQTAQRTQLFQGSAGANSGHLNEMKYKLQSRTLSKMYNTQSAVVDELLYGVDLDPSNITEEDIAKWQGGVAGKSSVRRNVDAETTLDRKKIVPSRPGMVAEFIFPDEDGLIHSKESVRAHNAEFESLQAERGAAGASAKLVSEYEHREVMHLDGHGRRGRRPKKMNIEDLSSRAAGLRGTTHDMSDVIQSTEKARVRRGSMQEGHSYGKPSGMYGRSSNDSCCVASAIASEATYARALQEGQDLLSTPYTRKDAVANVTHINQPTGADFAHTEADPRRATTVLVKHASDAAGNYIKPDEITRAKEARPHLHTKDSPFGIDVVTAAATRERFTTASNDNFGGGARLKATVPNRPPDTKASMALVVRAGQRPRGRN